MQIELAWVVGAVNGIFTGLVLLAVKSKKDREFIKEERLQLLEKTQAIQNQNFENLKERVLTEQRVRDIVEETVSDIRENSLDSRNKIDRLLQEIHEISGYLKHYRD